MFHSKSMKKVLSITLTVILCAFTFVVAPTTQKAQAATNEISVYSTNSYLWTQAAGQNGYAVTIDIKVKNIAYDKNVTLHGKNANDGNWYDTEATYVKSLDDGYELWRVQTTSWWKSYEFCLKYQVNDQTYWDNNDGQNYILNCEDNTLS